MIEEPEHEDLAPYALGALEEEERTRVEAHLRTCAACAAELSEYRMALSMLPYARAEAGAPRGAWEAIAGRLRRRGAPGIGAGEARRWPARWARMAPAFRPALVAVLAAAVIGLIAWNTSLQVQLSHRRSTVPALAGLQAEIVVDLVSIAPEGVSGLDGYLVMSRDWRKGGVVLAGLPALSSGRSYQVWFVRQDQSRARGGTFGVDSLGQAVALVDVPQPARDFHGVAISEEPAGGSTSPTGHDLLAGPIYKH